MPEAVIEYVSGFRPLEEIDALLEGADYEADEVALLRALRDVVEGKIALTDLPQRMEAAGVPSADAREFAIQYVGRILVPIAPVVPGLEAALRSWGSGTDEFSDVERVDIPEYRPETQMAKLAADAGVDVADPSRLTRLQFLLLSYARKSRNRAETLEALQRAQKVGGLDVPAEAAGRLLDGFDAWLAQLPAGFLDEKKEPAPRPAVASPAPTPAPVVPTAPVVPPAAQTIAAVPDADPEVEAFVKAAEAVPEAMPAPVVAAARPLPKDVLEPADEAELAVHQSKAQVAAQTDAPARTAQEKAVADIVAASGVKDEEAAKRLVRIVESRLSDVRDAYATRAELEKPIAMGGVGLSGRALADLTEKIEAAVDAVQAESTAKLEQGKADLARERRAQEAQGAEDRRKEEQLLAKRYAELTGKAPTESVSGAGARASVGLSSAQSIAQAAARIDADKVKQAVASARPPMPPRAPSGARPSMEDVKPVRRLTGPVDELRTINLTEFRRLSKDPKAAAEKVMDKVDLLEKDSYEQRLAAIKAWRESPLNRWYAESVREALARGLTVDALLAERRQAGGDVPSDAEVQAIIGLNARLRF